MKEVEREILLAFWKIHILHHAAKEPVYGQWMLTELRHHGYDVSPGTLYPMLKRMERHDWLVSERDKSAGPKGRIDYRITEYGREVLTLVQRQLHELSDELDEQPTTATL